MVSIRKLVRADNPASIDKIGLAVKGMPRSLRASLPETALNRSY